MPIVHRPVEERMSTNKRRADKRIVMRLVVTGLSGPIEPDFIGWPVQSSRTGSLFFFFFLVQAFLWGRLVGQQAPNRELHRVIDGLDNIIEVTIIYVYFVETINGLTC